MQAKLLKYPANKVGSLITNEVWEEALSRDNLSKKTSATKKALAHLQGKALVQHENVQAMTETYIHKMEEAAWNPFARTWMVHQAVQM